MRSTSAAMTASASGTFVPGGIGLARSVVIEITLQDELRSDRVALGATTPSRTALVEHRLRNLGRVSLVDFHDREREAAGKLSCKTSRARRQRMLGTVDMHGHAYDELPGLPFADQSRDRAKALGVALALERVERMRDAHERVADGDADAPRSEIEGQHGRFRSGLGRHLTRARRLRRAATDRCRAGALPQAAALRPAARTGRS